MAFQTRWLRVLPALAGVALAACGTSDSTKSQGQGHAGWNTKARSVGYRVDESFQSEQRSFDLKLDFAAGGVEVTELGSSVPVTMDASGRLTYQPGDLHPPAIYELIAISVLPPAGDELRVGHKWSYTRPDDAAANASNGIVAQERFDYEVKAVDAARIVVDVRGFLRIAPSAGLKQALTRNNLPAEMQTLLGAYKPYVVGSAEFDRASGETVSASGLRLPFAFLTAGDPIGPDKSIRYTLARQ